MIVTLATLSGFGSFLIGQPSGGWFFALHGIIGLALVLLVFWKVRRIWPRLVQPTRWERSTLVSMVALGAVLLVLASGLLWTSWQWPATFPNGLYWHIVFGILLAIALVLHLGLRFKPLRWGDVQGRRPVLYLLGALCTGGALWWAQQALNHRLALPGTQRRFTGSRNAGSDFPVTNWMFDPVPVIDSAAWRLRIYGAVAQESTFSYDELTHYSQDQLSATLDCTSGWYTTQQWQGVSVARLLDEAQPSAGATVVSFQSSTGYRWSLPLEEARHALVALHVADAPLTAGHGAPARLVAPGRRGFQWVKWLTAIEVRTTPDHGQWAVIFTSGFGG
jgi:hypothetical protein